jgi:hypothetical protein
MNAKGFVQAHGYEAGPTQRPRLSGALAAACAEAPTLAALWLTGTLEALAQAIDTPLAYILLLHVVLVVLAGVLYGQTFQRAANGHDGGWLLGLSFGFLCWVAGPVTALEWLTYRPLVVGQPALGLFLAHLLWGLLVGMLYPPIQRRLQSELDDLIHEVRPGSTQQPRT